MCFNYLIKILIFIITLFICYLFFFSSQSLFAVSVSVHDFKTIAAPRQAFSYSTLKHLGTKYPSGLPLCGITSHFLNCEARKKVLAAGTFHMPRKITGIWGRVLQKKEALCCFVSRCQVQ